MKLTDILTAEGKRLMKELKELSDNEVHVGFQHGEKASDEGVDLCDIAAWNEYGTDTMPSRPFLSQTRDKYMPHFLQFAELQVKTVINGATAKQAFNALGSEAKGCMQATITDGNYVENAPITIEGGWMRNKKSGKSFYVEGKASERPLIDSSHMINGVSYVVYPKGTRK